MCWFLVGNMSVGRREAFDVYRRDYEHNDRTIESNKRTLKQLTVEAKQLGEQLADSRNKISMSAAFKKLIAYILVKR